MQDIIQCNEKHTQNLINHNLNSFTFMNFILFFLHKSQSYNQDCKMIEVGIVIYYPIKSMEY